MLDKLLTMLKGEKKEDPIRDWCRKSLPLLEEVESDPAVKNWCRNEYSAYQPTAEGWKEWKRKLYDIMHSAYEAGVVCPEYREILERNGISFGQAEKAEESWLKGMTEEGLRGVMALIIRADYGSNGYFIHCAVGEGRLLRAVKAYLKKTK
ncbi:MAG: hypothetical protein IJX71_01045 [Oscillospiraceae bacterium]|nr:hypothetical protein [Oscillospiraceae bacterium]